MFQNRFFPEIHGNFGFGCMRLPMKDGKVNYDEFCRMADAFIASGLNYFDTAHGYIGGQSETAIRGCVSKRYDRSRFLLTDKLTTPYFNKEEDIRPFFENQLKWCGVEYFEFYLMHAQDRNNYQKYCVEENACPKGIRIPDMFSSLNAHEAFHNWNTGYYYNNVITGEGHGKASECIKCGKCEKVCPQHLPIRDLLKNVAKTFEK